MQLNRTASKLLFYSACCLTGIGVLFIYSSSAYWGKIHYPDELPFYIKQIIYAVAALVLCFILIRVPIKWNGRLILAAYVVSIILLILVLIPGIGLLRNGSRSWIGIGGFTLQPAEIAKITTLVYLSYILAIRKKAENIVQLKHFVIVFIPAALIMLQPDFGAVFLLVVTAMILFFVSNYPLKIFAVIVFSGIIAIVGLIISAPYRLKRITAFLNPWEDALNSGFQAVQSLMAIGPGGIFGHGFLKSRQKYLYLPEPQNDFIFSIILEEIGFIGGAIIVCIFACFLISGYRLAVASRESFAFYCIFSLTTLIGIQAVLNIGVVIGLFPVTGVTLPFISYGGTSLLFLWFAIGLMLNISKSQNRRR